jgi:hypothetical protein
MEARRQRGDCRKASVAEKPKADVAEKPKVAKPKIAERRHQSGSRSLYNRPIVILKSRIPAAELRALRRRKQESAGNWEIGDDHTAA